MKQAHYTTDEEWNQFFYRSAKAFKNVKITKEQALSKNLKFYWSDEVCNNGHVSFRSVDGDKCRTCMLNEKSSKLTASYAKFRRKIENHKRDKELDTIGNDYYNFDLED